MSLTKRFLKPIFFCFFLLASIIEGNAQGIRGKVTSKSGEVLPFASIYVRNLGDGVPTNQNGEYEFRLKKGVYDVLAQYLGFASEVKTVVVLEDWVELNFELDEQVYALQ